jgi:hypothetical protein
MKYSYSTSRGPSLLVAAAIMGATLIAVRTITA